MPWKKLDKYDIDLESKKVRFSRLAQCYLFSFALFSVGIKVGFSKYPWGLDPISWYEFFQKGPLLFVYPIPVALLFYLFWEGGPYSLISKEVMCDKCETSKPADGVKACSCGGEFFPLSHYKWVEPGG